MYRQAQRLNEKATDKLNPEPTYSVAFNPKDKTNQLILKALVKKTVENEPVETPTNTEISESHTVTESTATSGWHQSLRRITY